MYNVCACMGAMNGDPFCPCEMKRLGLSPYISETQVSKEVWDCLSDSDKTIINKLKIRAFTEYMIKNSKGELK